MSWGKAIEAVSSAFMNKRRRRKKAKPEASRNVSTPQFWENLYNQGSPGWDLGGPTPIFHDWLMRNRGHGERVCILGAGNGYDALAFARAGYDVVAVDFAPSPLLRLSEQAKKKKLSIEVIATDMFNLPKRWNGKFDLVVEYTTYCAIDPKRRNEYVDLVMRLLKRAGRLLALFFPMDQDPTVGPPYGISYAEIKTKFGNHFHFSSEEWPDLSVPTRRLRELLVIMERR